MPRSAPHSDNTAQLRIDLRQTIAIVRECRPDAENGHIGEHLQRQLPKRLGAEQQLIGDPLTTPIDFAIKRRIDFATTRIDTSRRNAKRRYSRSSDGVERRQTIERPIERERKRFQHRHRYANARKCPRAARYDETIDIANAQFTLRKRSIDER